MHRRRISKRSAKPHATLYVDCVRVCTVVAQLLVVSSVRRALRMACLTTRTSSQCGPRSLWHDSLPHSVQICNSSVPVCVCVCVCVCLAAAGDTRYLRSTNGAAARLWTAHSHRAGDYCGRRCDRPCCTTVLTTVAANGYAGMRVLPRYLLALTMLSCLALIPAVCVSVFLCLCAGSRRRSTLTMLPEVIAALQPPASDLPRYAHCVVATAS